MNRKLISLFGLILSVCALVCFCFVVIEHRNEIATYKDEIAARDAADKKFVEEEIESIYRLIELQNKTSYVIMDMQMRTFHYVRPHEEPVKFCPECINLKEELLKAQEPITMITVERHKELLEYEKRVKSQE